MKEFVIFTDSSADFNADIVKEMNVEVQPLTFHINDKNYQDWPDGREMDSKVFYQQLREGAQASTSQVNISEFVEAFRPTLEQGKDLLYLGFSSGLSGTVNSGRLAAEELAEEYPHAKIVVIDTLAASLGQGLLVWYAANLKKQGKSLEEIAEWVEENKLKVAHWFTVDDLNFLKRGGRLSGAAAFFGTMLSIKPVLHVGNDGKLTAMEKVRGRKQSLNTLVDIMEKTATDVSEQMVFISHGDCLEDAEYVAEQIKERLGSSKFYINFIGPVIGSHAGPGTVALFYMAKER